MIETANPEQVDITTGLSSDQSSQLGTLMSQAVEKAISHVLPSSMERVLHEIGYSNVVLGLLHLLVARSNESYDDLLRKALTLYSFALEAKEQGNRLAILNPDDEIVHEISGLGSSPEPHAVASE